MPEEANEVFQRQNLCSAVWRVTQSTQHLLPICLYLPIPSNSSTAFYAAARSFAL